VSTTPGHTVSAELRVKNDSTQTEQLKVNLYKFSVTSSGEVKLADRAPGDSFMDWASFSPQVFSAAPGEWRTIKMTIAVPKDAALGYYYAVGYSRAAAPKPVPGAASLQGQVVTFVLLDVQTPNAKRELKVTELSADRSVYEFLPAHFTIKVKNTGNIHTAPTGNIFITRGGKTVDTLSINPNQGNILPSSTRTFKVDWKDGFPVYEPKVVNGEPVSNADSTTATTLKWDFSKASKLRIGKYTAKMVLVYNDGRHDIPINGQVSFWVVPWRVIFGILFVLTVPPLLVYLFMRRRYRKRLEQERRKSRHV
jgi:hypothetical protein